MTTKIVLDDRKTLLCLQMAMYGVIYDMEDCVPSNTMLMLDHLYDGMCKMRETLFDGMGKNNRRVRVDE